MTPPRLLRHQLRNLLLPLAVAVAVALIAISETGYHGARRAVVEAGSLSQARTQLQLLVTRILDAETGQRGYLLTRRDSYRQQYEQARTEVDASLQRLRAHYGRPAGQAPARAGGRDRTVVLAELEEQARTRLSELALALTLFEQGEGERWQELMRTNIGSERMRAVRALSEELLARESVDIVRVRADLQSALAFSRIGVTILCVVSLLALVMWSRQRRARATERQRHAEALQAERDQLEVEVRRRTTQLVELNQHLQTAREDERHRLARELHDELGALLTAAKLDAARLKSRLAQVAPEAAQRLAHLSGLLDGGIALKRRIIEDLRPSSLSNLGLLPALEILLEDSAERCGLAIRHELDEVRLSAADQLTVYRLVQEALTNIAKHAQASAVQVTLATRDGQAWLQVCDDGVGFDAAHCPASAHGLLGMHYRVEAAGGQLRVDAAPGQGTRITATLPLRDLADPAEPEPPLGEPTPA